MVIWKFSLNPTDIQEVTMPVGAEILSVQNQGDTVCMWAIVNPDAERQKRTIEIIGTGNPMQDLIVKGKSRRHIGTVQFRGGSLVLHVFEVV